MSSKRKWDDAPVETPTKAAKVDETKTASEAAAAAAAIAAKIAAQFAGGAGSMGGEKDPHDADFTFDIDINDVRNRYMLTKGSTQAEVRIYTFASSAVIFVLPSCVYVRYQTDGSFFAS